MTNEEILRVLYLIRVNLLSAQPASGVCTYLRSYARAQATCTYVHACQIWSDAYPSSRAISGLPRTRSLRLKAGVAGENVPRARRSPRTFGAGENGPFWRKMSAADLCRRGPRARRSWWRYRSVSQKSRKMCCRI